MVAKKTAVQQSESGRTTGAAASGGAGKAAAGARASETPEPKETPTGKKKSTAASHTTARKQTSAKATSTKATSTKAAPEKATTTKAAPAKSATKKTATSKTATGKAGVEGAKKSAPKKKAAARSTTAAKKTVASATEDAAEAAKTTGATTVVAKKTQGTATATKKPGAVPKARGTAEPGELAVRPGEDPWTPEEAEEARTELQTEVLQLGSEIAAAEEGLAGLMRDSGDGAGDDDADTGTKNITREHEMSLAANAREMLLQAERALERLDAGTYGLCENCGNPIGKARMQAFPRATLCVECKQKQERRN
ncbi:TraR/DksA C4-type zinc finger protein [Streptomyces endophyticus]|uniref:TraR/DksA C4-type zinc finger protein n=1 Tax=Streptomyces endophyticus TaxID=714166 RepID=A0ABU6F995_9ACTN|nr:TraR/DksA C4-type zinc finger protein [Streptomyces endophyticus]MEB8340384.1 TraR/DksA C4-type zinc finger protein [Streptomyces endophyticus]